MVMVLEDAIVISLLGIVATEVQAVEAFRVQVTAPQSVSSIIV
jgi:hypothetical protein